MKAYRSMMPSSQDPMNGLVRLCPDQPATLQLDPLLLPACMCSLYVHTAGSATPVGFQIICIYVSSSSQANSWAQSVEIRVFPTPTSFMLTSFAFGIIIVIIINWFWGVFSTCFFERSVVFFSKVLFDFNWLFLKLKWLICNSPSVVLPVRWCQVLEALDEGIREGLLIKGHFKQELEGSWSMIYKVCGLSRSRRWSKFNFKLDLEGLREQWNWTGWKWYLASYMTTSAWIFMVFWILC